MVNKNVIKIDVQQTTQDFEIGSKTYTMDFSDDKIKMYGEYINNITAAIDKVRDDNQDPLADISGQLKEIEDQLRGFLDIAFNKDAYDEIYEVVGRSTVVMTNVITQVMEQAQEQMELFKELDRQAKKADYYTKKNKK